jgi:uncharacterized protein (TIGR00661 family)
MRILYGVVGEGMGHATRSRVVLEHLLAAGHSLVVVVSGRAFGMLAKVFAGRERIQVTEIRGLHLRFDGNDLDLLDTVLANAVGAPTALLHNLDAYRRAVRGFDAEVVISDFESFAYLYGRAHNIPVISIDNMQIINRCHHDAFTSDEGGASFQLAKWAVKAKLPGAYHYLVSSFFYPPVRKPRTTLIPPILRPEVLAARREPGQHVLVYQTAAASADHLLAALAPLPQSFLVYGTGRTSSGHANIELRGFSETQFIEDLRTAKAVIAGGGYSLMGEAVHLHVPMFAVPITGQYEQMLNARYLELSGFGRYGDGFVTEELAQFLDDADDMADRLQRYVPRNNNMLLACVDELLVSVAADAKPPAVLYSDNLGSLSSDEVDTQ